jgi:hypothetical protein
MYIYNQINKYKHNVVLLGIIRKTQKIESP